MSIELPCGGVADPFAVSKKAKTFRCSKGCSHPVTQDHRALLAEIAERSGVNDMIEMQRMSESRNRHLAGWTVGIGSLWGINRIAQTAAEIPDSWAGEFINFFGSHNTYLGIGAVFLILAGALKFKISRMGR